MTIVRVAICQPLIPAYRVPVFNSLGGQKLIKLTIYSGGNQGSLQTIEEESEGYNIIKSNIIEINIAKHTLKWQTDQIKAVMSREYDVVILPWDSGYLSLLPSLILGKLKGVSTILWGHGYSKRQNIVTDKIRNFIGQKADAVLLYNKSTRLALIDAGFTQSKIFVAQNALDARPISTAINSWSRDIEKLNEFKKSYGLMDSKVVIFVSRLEKENRTNMLLYAFNKVIQEIDNSKLVIIGDGSDKVNLENLAKELGLKNNVIFTGAIYEEIEIAPWMMSACVFCYPVNIGLSIIHALHYGLPIVTSNAIEQHNPEIDSFQEGVNGFLYQDGSVDDMSHKLLSILKSSSLKNKLSAGARGIINDFSLETMVEGFVKAILSVTNKR